MGLTETAADAESQSGDDRSVRIAGDVRESVVITGDHAKVIVVVGARLAARPSGKNPYRGLAAFQEQDAHLFFGRASALAALEARLVDLRSAEARLVAVLGPSGTGKSSLVRAGLAPLLAERRVLDRDVVRAIVMTPGRSPCSELAAVLHRSQLTFESPSSRALLGEPSELHARLMAKDSGPLPYRGLANLASALTAATGDAMALVVDQFEEMFTQTEEPGPEHEAFVENVMTACSTPGLPFFVILTARTDYVDRTSAFPRLNAAISRYAFFLPVLTRAELREVIERPATESGQPLDASVVGRLVEDADGRRGALPLLEFALTRIWDERTRGVSETVAYERMNGLGGALAGRAEDIYDQIARRPDSKEALAMVRHLFMRLCGVADDTAVRRRATFDELLTHEGAEALAREIVDQFSQASARFVTTWSEGPATYLEVTHERLFFEWGRLRDWIVVRPEDRRIHQRLANETKAWKSQGRPTGLLWRPPLLEQGERLRAFPLDDLSQDEIAFLDASRKAHRRSIATSRGAVGSLIILTLGLAIASVDLYEAAFEAREATKRAEAATVTARNNGIAAVAAAEEARDPLVALLLLSELPADAEVPGIEMTLAPLGELVLPNEVQYLDPGSEPRVSFGPDGRLMAKALDPDAGTEADAEAETERINPEPIDVWGGVTLLHDHESGEFLVQSGGVTSTLGGTSDGSSGWAHAFLIRQGTAVRYVGETGKVLEWSAPNWSSEGRQVAQLRGMVNAEAFAMSHDGRYVLTWPYEAEGDPTNAPSVQSVVFWDTSTGNVLFSIDSSEQQRVGAGFGSGDECLVVEDPKEYLRWWSLDPVSSKPFILRDLPPGSSGILKTGCREILASAVDGTMLLVDRKSGTVLHRVPTAVGGPGNPVTAGPEFSPDDQQVALGYADGSVTIWDQRSEGADVLRGPNAVKKIVWAPDGRAIAVATKEAVARWSLPLGRPVHFDETDLQGGKWYSALKELQSRIVACLSIAQRETLLRESLEVARERVRACRAR